MLKINKDEYGDRALDEANRILDGCVGRRIKLKYRLALTAFIAALLFAAVCKLI